MPDPATGFHLAQPQWLWLLLVPGVVALWLSMTSSLSDNVRLKQYADEHLLPYLLDGRGGTSRVKWSRFARWLLLWTLLVLAMAGPRWGYTDVKLFRPDSDLVVLLDISRSMLVDDVTPNRLARARQELEDLLNRTRGVRTALVAFASVPHVLAPLTEDTGGIRRVLPALSTDLVDLQGSRLTDALQVAAHMLGDNKGEEGNRAILIISDGDFTEPDLKARVAELSRGGVAIYTLGIGTPGGGFVPGPNGEGLVDRQGALVRSRLVEPVLQEISRAGGGEYVRADFHDKDVHSIIDAVMGQGATKSAGDESMRVWHERFYWLVGLALLILLPTVAYSGAGLRALRRMRRQ